MDQKLVAFVLTAFAIVNANYYPLRFKEKARDYIEVVKPDTKQNIVELEVPAHGSIHPMGVLNDFSTGYSAKKDYQENICYISRIEKGFPSPGKMQNNMEMSKGQTDSGKYEIIKQKIYPIRNLTRFEVGPKISAFCYGYEMVLVAVYNKHSVEKELGQLVRGADQEKRARRQVYPTVKVLEVDNMCNGGLSLDNYKRCPATFNLRCKWRTTNCYFTILCYQQSNTIGHVCNTNHHLLVTRVCCDLVCP